jgi:integrase/recombinase XerD
MDVGQMNDLLDLFLKDMEDRGLAPDTVYTAKYSVSAYLRFLQERGIDPALAGRLDIKAYLDLLHTRELGKATVKVIFGRICSFYDYLAYCELITGNPIRPVMTRYLQSYKGNMQQQTHKLISVEEAAALINSLVDVRDKALVLLLLKTGIRKKELISLDIEDINWAEQSIRLKPTAKRTNRTVFFDDECSAMLKRWLKVREARAPPGESALFLGSRGRLKRGGIRYIIEPAARRVGIHNAESKRLEDHFAPHACRHFFTTHLLRAGMPREYVKELRGDVRGEAIDLYHHIDMRELRESYLAHIPQFGL